jgi:hypothetical protein
LTLRAEPHSPLTPRDGTIDPVKKRVAVLGSTGSIGRQALDVIRQFPDRFEVVALAAGRNDAELARQVAECRPRHAWAEADTPALRDALAATGTKWLSMDEMATAVDVDLLLVATAGAAGLMPTIRALEAGRPVAIANKEVLVMAGHLVRAAMLRHLAVPLGRGGPRGPPHPPHCQRWRLPRLRLRPARRRHARAGPQAPHLEHGQEDHHR